MIFAVAIGEVTNLIAVISSSLLGLGGLFWVYFQYWANRHNTLREKLWDKKFALYSELIQATNSMVLLSSNYPLASDPPSKDKRLLQHVHHLGFVLLK
jgi:hypothetical protein